MATLLGNFYVSIPIAFLCGLVPSCVWLWFWLREDALHPEPRKRLALCFLAGMAAVILVLPFEKMVQDTITNGIYIILSWAALEEIFKFAAAYIVAFTNHDYDEPIDAVIYMITVALGFAALENALYILTPLSQGLLLSSFVTGNLRFVGSTLLHTVASATIGIFMAFEFYKPRVLGRLYTFLGLLCAIALHTLFNASIMLGGGGNGMYAFYAVWLAVIVLILMFEKVKTINN